MMRMSKDVLIRMLNDNAKEPKSGWLLCGIAREIGATLTAADRERLDPWALQVVEHYHPQETA